MAVTTTPIQTYKFNWGTDDLNFKTQETPTFEWVGETCDRRWEDIDDVLELIENIWEPPSEVVNLSESLIETIENEDEFTEMIYGFHYETYGRSCDKSAWHYATVNISSKPWVAKFDHRPVTLKFQIWSAPTLKELFHHVETL